MNSANTYIPDSMASFAPYRKDKMNNITWTDGSTSAVPKGVTILTYDDGLKNGDDRVSDVLDYFEKRANERDSKTWRDIVVRARRVFQDGDK